ncbi:MAG: hypothetical protein ACOC8B_04055 [Gemmatimonadota bacterium]
MLQKKLPSAAARSLIYIPAHSRSPTRIMPRPYGRTHRTGPSRRRARRRGRIPASVAAPVATVLALAAILAACDASERSTSPEEPEPTPDSSTVAAATPTGVDAGDDTPPPGTVSGTLGGGNSADGAGPVTIGELPEARMLVEVTVTGIMDLVHLFPPHMAGDPGGSTPPASDEAWDVRVRAPSRSASAAAASFSRATVSTPNPFGRPGRAA